MALKTKIIDSDNLKLDEFLQNYLKILKMALTSGVRSVSFSKWENPEKMTFQERTEFLRGCHRGFNIAQNSIFQDLRKIDDDDTLSKKDKDYRSLLLRKVMDSIVYTLFRNEIHVIKRLILHDSPPHINIDEAERILRIANGFNSESRKVFALVSDLTTCVHISDIVRIDYRNQPKLELIEVKSGKTNIILSNFLDHFKTSDGTLEIIKQCQRIPEQLRKQAQRMMRQRIRLDQVKETVNTEKGTDISLNVPVRFSTYTHEVLEFDEILNELCNQALQKGIAGGVINDCIHICVALGSSFNESRQKAINGILFCKKEHRKNRPEVTALDSKIQAFIPSVESYRIINPILSNLKACACRPFPMWGIERSNLIKILSGKMTVLFAFDISGFIWTAEDFGLKVIFSSKQETESLRKKLGRPTVPTWGNRMIKLSNGRNEQIILGGTLGRFINDLICPRSMLMASQEELNLSTSEDTIS